MRRRAIIVVLIVVAAAACSSFDAATDSIVTTADAGGEARADAQPDAAPGSDASDASDASIGCPVGDGPDMRVVTLLGGRKICVDRTEVTTAQYATFRTRALGLSPKEHTALETKVPAACAPLAAVALSNAGGPDALPQVNVSFCSAAFYCAAQGKRLCGNAVDGAGVVITDGGTSPPLEWTLACANGKAENYFPWGSVEPSVAKSAGCLTQSTSPGAQAPRDAGAASACGPGDKLGPYDMIGNVWEWVNLRSDVDGGASYTGQLGGSFVGATVDGCKGMTGADAVHGEYANGNSETGFRCCGDAP